MNENEKPKTVKVSKEELTEFIKKNNISVPVKVWLELRDDVKELLVNSGKQSANHDLVVKELEELKTAYTKCPARVMVETGGNLLKGAKKIYFAVGLLGAIIGAVIIFCAKYLQ